MSALGAIPGFAFPELDYGQSEYAEFTAPNNANIVAGQIVTQIVKAGGGNAVYVSDVFCGVTTDATVGNRQITIVVFGPSGNVIGRYDQSLVIPPSVGFGFQWSLQIVAAYSVPGFGYSPLTNVILLPGGSISIVLFTNGATDVLTSMSAVGRRFPTRTASAIAAQAAPTPLLT